ncbi:MAG: hypothetical protein ACYDCL_02310 [Myxococcales bacterium]
MGSIAVAAVCLLAGISARADDDLGIKVGDGRLHLQLDLQGRYDTFAELNAQNQPEGDFLFDIRPGLKLDIPSPIFAFDLAADADGILYLNAPGLDRVLADGSVGIGINRAGIVGLDIADQFNRSDNNNMVALPFAIISDYNDASAKIGIRPGGGALAIEPGFDFIYEHFEPVLSTGLSACPGGSPLCDPSNASDMDFYEEKISLNLRWRFLPKTALLLGGDFMFVNYPTATSGLAANAPMDIVDGTIGIAGLLTSRVEVVLKAGYSQTLINGASVAAVPGLAASGENRTLIGQAQIGYIFSETGSLKIGVVRLLNPAPTVLADYTDTRPYLNFRWLIAGRLTLHLDVSYDLFDYQFNSEGQVGRNDESLHIDVGPEFEILRWLRVAAGYDFTDLQSSDSAIFTYNSTSIFGGSGYNNHEVYLRVTLAY